MDNKALGELDGREPGVLSTGLANLLWFLDSMLVDTDSNLLITFVLALGVYTVLLLTE